jgi:hypothetical protein
MIIYPFTLQQVAIVLGILYVLTHGWSLWQPALSKKWLLAFPRHYPSGVILMIAACLWFCWLIFNADLMDFAPYQSLFLLISVALAAGMIACVREFLAVRALGALLLLLANVLLDAAFLDNHASKFVITVIAYIYIVAGIFFVASPYLLRDLLAWYHKNDRLAKPGSLAGVALGVILLALGIFVY